MNSGFGSSEFSPLDDAVCVLEVAVVLIATFIAALGFVSVALITQLRGYRLGGTITLGVVTVYTLKNFVMFPVFLLSTALAYLGLDLLKRRTLIYGRDELIAAILIGTLIPVIALTTLSELASDVRNIAFIGSILPGLAAYNYHQMKPEYRRQDLGATLGLFAVLFALGAALVSPSIAQLVSPLTPPILLAQSSEIAVFRGAVAVEVTEQPLMPRQVLVFVLMVGLIAAEYLRARFDVRTGVIAAALLAVFTLENQWLFVLYVTIFGCSYLIVTVVHHRTLRYGRVLLGIGTAAAALMTVVVTVLLPISRGLAAFFTGIVAGVMAYNTHATAPAERRVVFPLQLLVFVPLLIVLRLIAAPGDAGFPQAVTLPVMLGAVVVTGAALWYAYTATVAQPDDSAVLSSSVLSGGDGS